VKIAVHLLTPARWPDFEAVFGDRGCSVARNCGCMYYRRSGSVRPGPENRAALKVLVDAGTTPGLIGYRGDQPVGWVSLGPRQDYEKLRRSPVMKAVDAVPVWSIVCFVVPSVYRGQGVARALLGGAIGYARRRGARWLEAYPVDRPQRGAGESMWFGALSMYVDAGFEEVARRRPQRPIVRLRLR
jgi:GNAT superfamily N-acetyltransferase